MTPAVPHPPHLSHSSHPLPAPTAPPRASEPTRTTELALALALSLLLTACDNGNALRPIAQAGAGNPVSAPASAPAPRAVTLPTEPATPFAHPADDTLRFNMLCNESVTAASGSYVIENNVWGKGALTDWSQCVGATNSPRRGLAARWTWDWKYQGDNVKAYPEVVFGHKPGTARSTTPLLPRKLGEVRRVVMDYDISTKRNGTGNLSVDIWLTDTPAPTTFAVPPITHEVMIWLEIFGPMYAGGDQIDTVSIHGIPYRVYVGEKFGLGWRYIAFKPENTPMQPVAQLDLMPYLLYLETKGLVSPESYLANINLGNEIISGAGATQVNHLAIEVE